jgi:hypothetical protein
LACVLTLDWLQGSFSRINGDHESVVIRVLDEESIRNQYESGVLMESVVTKKSRIIPSLLKTPFVRDAKNWPAQSSLVKRLLGLGVNQPLPKEGMPPRLIQGVKVWVVPLVERPHLRRNFAGLRVRCSCPVCGKEFALGRLAQHVRVHE